MDALDGFHHHIEHIEDYSAFPVPLHSSQKDISEVYWSLREKTLYVYYTQELDANGLFINDDVRICLSWCVVSLSGVIGQKLHLGISL